MSNILRLVAFLEADAAVLDRDDNFTLDSPARDLDRRRAAELGGIVEQVRHCLLRAHVVAVDKDGSGA
jgi:hypothetical protein